MHAKLIILFNNATLEIPTWALLDNKGQLEKPPVVGEIDRLMQSANNRDVWVFVPAEDVRISLVTMPKLSQHKLMQALPFALEDEVSTDIETIHVASGNYLATGKVAVAICSHAKMQTWLSLLASWHITPQHVCPINFAVSFQENTWHILLTAQLAIIRLSAWQIFQCDRENLQVSLEALLKSQALPAQISVINESNDLLQATWQWPITLQETTINQSDLLQMLATISPQTSINLLQGVYQAKHDLQHSKRFLRVISYSLCASVIAVILSYPIVSNYVLSHELQTIDQQIATIYKRHFPQATSIVAPKMRMQAKLKHAGGGQQTEAFIALLNQVASAYERQSGLKLLRLDYQGHQLNLNIMANTTTLTDFSNELQRLGLKVQQQNVTLNGEKVAATLVIHT